MKFQPYKKRGGGGGGGGGGVGATSFSHAEGDPQNVLR